LRRKDGAARRIAALGLRIVAQLRLSEVQVNGSVGEQAMVRDQDYFRRRAAEARASACVKDAGEGVEVAGHLALAYGALARRRAAKAAVDRVDPVVASAPDAAPLMLRD
jgi:hypothetical protein